MARIKTTTEAIVKKEEGQKTLVEIIDDARSGRPAKSEIESKEKRAFLKKGGLNELASKASGT